MAFKFKDKGGGSNPHTIKLKSGESITGVLRGELYEYEHAFKPGDKPKFRFRINLIVIENGALVAKILEGGWKIYAALRDLQSAGWDLEKSYVRISRQGETQQNTVYSVATLPSQVSAESLAKIEHVKLHALAQNPVQPEESGPTFGDERPMDDLPF